MSDSNTVQGQLPGTETVIGTYRCGHGRSHRVPSDDVRVFRSGGAGFVGYCDCGPDDLESAEERPQLLGDHVTLLGGTSLDPAFWLALEEIAEDGWDHDGAGSSFGKTPYAERRQERKSEYVEQVTAERAVATDGGEDRQCRALTASGERCSNVRTYMTDSPLCGPHSNMEDVELIDDVEVDRDD